MEEAGLGTIGVCPLVSTAVTAFVTQGRTISVRCHRDCNYTARLRRLPKASAAATLSGAALAGKRVQLRLDQDVAPGWYQLSVSLVHPTRPGKPLVRTSMPFAVRLSSQRRAVAGCGGARAHASGWGRRRRRPARRRRPRAAAGRGFRRRRDHECLAARALGAGARGAGRAARRGAAGRGAADLPRRLPAGLGLDAADDRRRARSSPPMWPRSCGKCRRSAT